MQDFILNVVLIARSGKTQEAQTRGSGDSYALIETVVAAHAQPQDPWVAAVARYAHMPNWPIRVALNPQTGKIRASAADDNR